MPSSGTIGATVYRASDLMDSIALRCGVSLDKITPVAIDVITGVMWRTLAAWSNRGINLWRVYHALYPLYQGQQVYALAQGDIDIQRAIWRRPVRLSPAAVTSSDGNGVVANLSDGDLSTACTQVATNGNLLFDWGSGVTQQVGLVGINSAVARTYTLIFEISNDGLTFTQVLAPAATAYTAGGWQWYEIDPPGTPARYFRVRESGGAVLSLNEVSLAQNWQDVDVTRWSLDQWTTNPSKRAQGTPRQYYIERLLTPQINLWPVPGSTEILNLLSLWVHRHIEDVGDLSNTLNIPQRWYQPLIDVCSWQALPEVPGADLSRYEMLKDLAANVSLPDAEKEERDRGTIEIRVGLGAYTR